MAKRNFDEGREEGETHEATLGGRTFHLKPHFPPNLFIDEQKYKGLEGTIQFLRKVIVPADREAFEELLNADDVFVKDTDIVELSKWYVEVVANRPTNGSSSSRTGAEPTSDTSEEASSGPVGATKRSRSKISST